VSIWSDERGVAAVIVGLVATLVIAIAGLGVEVVSWYRTDRAMQNAADSAAVGAATNGTGTYRNEAKAVAAQYGDVDGGNGATVTALNNQTCPDGQTDCVKVIGDGRGAAVFLAGHRLPRTSAVECGDDRRHPVTPILSCGADQ
jgi:Flp pilus assembly protein TadG